MAVKVKMKSIEQIIKDHDMENGGECAKYIDNEAIRLMDPYTPKDSGALILSAHETASGSRLIEQGGPMVPYAERVYCKPMNFSGAPKRGNYWFERAMNEGGRESIKRGIERITGVKFR